MAPPFAGEAGSVGVGRIVGERSVPHFHVARRIHRAAQPRAIAAAEDGVAVERRPGKQTAFGRVDGAAGEAGAVVRKARQAADADSALREDGSPRDACNVGGGNGAVTELHIAVLRENAAAVGPGEVAAQGQAVAEAHETPFREHRAARPPGAVAGKGGSRAHDQVVQGDADAAAVAGAGGVALDERAVAENQVAILHENAAAGLVGGVADDAGVVAEAGHASVRDKKPAAGFQYPVAFEDRVVLEAGVVAKGRVAVGVESAAGPRSGIADDHEVVAGADGSGDVGPAAAAPRDVAGQGDIVAHGEVALPEVQAAAENQGAVVAYDGACAKVDVAAVGEYAAAVRVIGAVVGDDYPGGEIQGNARFRLDAAALTRKAAGDGDVVGGDQGVGSLQREHRRQAAAVYGERLRLRCADGQVFVRDRELAALQQDGAAGGENDVVAVGGQVEGNGDAARTRLACGVDDEVIGCGGEGKRAKACTEDKTAEVERHISFF